MYAATPPLEALRIIISHAATYPECGPQRVVVINDVRRAYFYAKITRDVYIELPKEDPKFGTGLLGKLKLCLYGTKVARDVERAPRQHRLRPKQRTPLCVLAPEEGNQDISARG